jgi:hypothetical protein
MPTKQAAREIAADIAILGGGTGGVAAALAALRRGKTVILSEETDWIGGQLTSQAVPPDENPWIEETGCTRSYRRFRDDIRDFYRRFYPLMDEARAAVPLNPGGGRVSKLCHEPRVAVTVLNSYLLPYVSMGMLTLLLKHAPTAATTDRDRVTSVTVQDRVTGGETVLRARYFLDATELGDLLPLTGAEYVAGAESQAETGEPHAVDGPAQPLNQQAITWCFAMSHHPGEDHTIERPAQYNFWRDYQAPFWPERQLSWSYPNPVSNRHMVPVLFAQEAPAPDYVLWEYRKILSRDNLLPGACSSDITLVNWPQNDYWLGPLAEVSPDEAARHLEGARQLSLSYLYWMQTEAPRRDGGVGYPGLKIRPDVTGTPDGLAKSPYIRESRRIRAEFTVVEQHLSEDSGPEAVTFADSVGIGYYRIDLHPSTTGDTYIDIGSRPFQIPLGSLIPVRLENLLPACKNLGVTHITNGCYRLHPVEWNIGEAAGALAAHCVTTGLVPRQVRNSPVLLDDFQRDLRHDGFELAWRLSRLC